MIEEQGSTQVIEATLLSQGVEAPSNAELKAFELVDGPNWVLLRWADHDNGGMTFTDMMVAFDTSSGQTKFQMKVNYVRRSTIYGIRKTGPYVIVRLYDANKFLLLELDLGQVNMPCGGTSFYITKTAVANDKNLFNGEISWSASTWWPC